MCQNSAALIAVIVGKLRARRIIHCVYKKKVGAPLQFFKVLEQVRQVNVEPAPLDHQLSLHVAAIVAEVEERHVNLGVVNLVKLIIYTPVGNLKLRLWRAEDKHTARKALLELLQFERVRGSFKRLHAERLERLVADGSRGDD